MPADPAVLSTLQSLVAGPGGSPASTPDSTSFSIGFLAALGAKELQDQQAGMDRQASKQAKTQASPAQMGQGNLGQTDQLVTLARFAQSGLLPQLMGGAPAPMGPPPMGAPAPMGPPPPMGMAGPPGQMAPGPMPPGMPPPGMPPGMPPPGMAGPPPPMGAPQGQIPPAILMALQSLVRPTAGLV